MAGYNAILELRRLEKEVDALGFVLGAPNNRWRDDLGDRVAITPKGIDSLPVYSRDAEIFIGTLDELRIWIRGVQWARHYDSMLGLSDDKKRTKKEDHERGRQLIEKLKKDHTNEKAV
jgi:hypothetical protein